LENKSIKISLIGSFGVGKTSLFRRFINETFSYDYKSTLGVQIQKKIVVDAKGNEVSLILWDTEGHKDLSHIKSPYLLGSKTFIYVFDLTRTDTFNNINEQISFLKSYFPNTLIKLVGNKSDAVNLEIIRNKLNEYSVKYDFLTSAKTGEEINVLFDSIINELDSNE